MKKRMITMISAGSMFLVFGLFSPVDGTAGVNINIGIPLPGLVFSAPPALVVIPGTYAYIAPDVDVDIFFYQGYWYRPYEGLWYIAADYRGPWSFIAIDRVPSVFLNLPPYYRRVRPGYERMPYGMVQRNWRTWENERYWDRYERRRDYDDENAPHHGHGHGWGHGMGMGMRGDD